MYCAKCERLIKKLGMDDHVALKGIAKPSEILRQGWMYLQVGAFSLDALTLPLPYMSNSLGHIMLGSPHLVLQSYTYMLCLL